jgi:hypothetical protein
LIRVRRSAEGADGVRLVEMEIALPEGVVRASGWRSHDTAEIDFTGSSATVAEWVGPEPRAALVGALREMPFGNGLATLRLRFGAGEFAELMPEAAGLSRRTGFVVDPLPALRAVPGKTPPIRPLGAIDEAGFVALCEEIFAAELLGHPKAAGIAPLARRLYRGEPIEGWTGYQGFLVGARDEVFGIFFTGPPGTARLSFGLAGMLPAARRTRLALAAAVAVEQRLRELGATSLRFEIDERNRRSLALARRRGATPEYRVLVCPAGAG